jgi:uncharacterized protein YrrD
MLHSFKDLKQFHVRALDQPEGTVDDIYFDDETWSVRYLVAGIGFWLFGRQCLVGTELFGQPDLEAREFPVQLTAKQLQEAPGPESDPPVSDPQLDTSGAWPPYLIGSAGGYYTPLLAEHQIADLLDTPKPAQTGDPHLRSMNEVSGYDVAATDGDIGSVADFLIDPADWRVRYMVVDTGTWLPGKNVITASSWCSRIDWPARQMVLEVTKEQVESCPDITRVDSLKRSDEMQLFEHYGMPPYWTL